MKLEEAFLIAPEGDLVAPTFWCGTTLSHTSNTATGMGRRQHCGPRSCPPSCPAGYSVSLWEEPLPCIWERPTTSTSTQRPSRSAQTPRAFAPAPPSSRPKAPECHRPLHLDTLAPPDQGPHLPLISVSVPRTRLKGLTTEL